MAVHMFPSFEKVYTPRGRQTLCEQRSPDLTHNDTIKRIQSSQQNTEFLKNLVKKQVEKSKRQKQGKKLSNDVKTKDIETANKLNINKFKQKRPQQQQRGRSLGKLESVDHSKRQQKQFAIKSGCGIIRPLATKTPDLVGATYDCNSGNVGVGTLKYYLQLATDYYQQGFLQNIKYLENLGERNQLRRKRQIQLQLQQQKNIFTLTVGSLSEKNTNSLNLKAISLETGHITDATLNSCDIKQQEINQINPILWRKRQQNDKLTVNNLPLNNDKNRNCAIRINIKPQTANTKSHQCNFFNTNKEICGKKKIILESKDFNSMKDYLNGNLEYTQLPLQPGHQHHHYHLQQPQARLSHNLSVNNHNYSAKVLQLDTLIDNLRELDIQENCTNLPRITLTDYTQKYPNEFDTNSRTHEPSAEESNKRLNSYLIKQSSLDCCNLDIPRETHYRSEARPPYFFLFTMVAIEHRSTSANTTASILSPTSNTSATSASASAASTTLSTLSTTTANIQKKMSSTSDSITASKSAVSQRDVEVKVSKKSALELSKKVLKLDLTDKDVEEYSLKSPKSPVVGGRLSQQTSLSSSVDVEDRKTLREALYQGIFHRHRRTIFAVGSFLRMLRSRNSQYNTIRSSSEGEDIDEVR